MTKITLSLDDFKALASEVRLNILRTLDSRNKSLKEISQTTKLHETTVHEHLLKLIQAEYVKRIERKGHKWVYYKLTWKGSSLLHPDNARIVVLFCSTFATFVFGIFGIINVIGQFPMFIVKETSQPGMKSAMSAINPILLILFTILCIIIFSILISISIRTYKNNKEPRL